MQDSSKVELFRSGAANDEFDGLARYSDKSWPIYRQFGWQRGKVLVPLGMESLFFYLLQNCLGKLGGTARKEARPNGEASYFL
jgi:hypothetical protein